MGKTEPKRDAVEVAQLLAEIGQRMRLRAGNPYRAKAYTRAAENLLTLTLPLEKVVAEDRLREIPGVGDAIADIIAKLHGGGTHPLLEDMRSEFPASALEMLRVPGLKPEKAIKLHKELGIASLKELEDAARSGQLKEAKGFGAGLQTKILQGIDMLKRGTGQKHVHRAAELLEQAAKNLRASHAGVTRVTPAGDFRRGCELVSDFALVAQQPKKGQEEISAGPVRVHLSDAAHYGVTLLFATGSEQHLAALKQLAGKKSMHLDEHGLQQKGKRIAKSEEEIYAALGLPFIAPELRESGDEVALALKGKLPRPVEDGDIRGILHAHTDQSDGVHTLAQMAKAARSRGYGYLGLTDHSQSAHYAGGLKADEVVAQQAEIEKLNRTFKGDFHVFKGIESDIVADGSLDYPVDFLGRFEFIIASVHSHFRMEKQAQTERILKAVANPFTTVLGHITGRQLLRRPGYELDVERVLKACADHGVAVEINANPWRLDLDWRWYRHALDMGCLFSINADAHSTAEIDLTHWGVVMARKGAIPKERVLNALDRDAFAAHIAARRASALGQKTRKASPPSPALPDLPRKRGRKDKGGAHASA
jgi:DNA polymerase (family 10)